MRKVHVLGVSYVVLISSKGLPEPRFDNRQPKRDGERLFYGLL